MARMTRQELEEMLEAKGFKYLGSYIASDCSILNWVRPTEDGQFEVASADGWLGNWEPYIRKIDKERLYRLVERIMSEGAPSVWAVIGERERRARCDIYLNRMGVL